MREVLESRIEGKRSGGMPRMNIVDDWNDKDWIGRDAMDLPSVRALITTLWKSISFLLNV